MDIAEDKVLKNTGGLLFFQSDSIDKALAWADSRPEEAGWTYLKPEKAEISFVKAEISSFEA